MVLWLGLIDSEMYGLFTREPRLQTTRIWSRTRYFDTSCYLLRTMCRGEIERLFDINSIVTIEQGVPLLKLNVEVETGWLVKRV